MVDHSELKRLAETFPSDLDWDSNTEPFFNGPTGESLGGGADGTYTVYGKPFQLPGEDYDYDGPTYVERCGIDFAKFMVSARDGILALMAEVERLRTVEGDAMTYKAGMENVAHQRDQLKAEIAGLKTGYEAYEQANAGLKTEVARSTEREILQLAEIEVLRRDKDRLDALEASFWDVRHTSTPIGCEGDSSQSIEIVGSWMDSPRERVIGENYDENLRAAIDQAIKAPAYPPARPEYETPDFGGGGGNKARRRASELGIDYAAMGKGEQS